MNVRECASDCAVFVHLLVYVVAQFEYGIFLRELSTVVVCAFQAPPSAPNECDNNMSAQIIACAELRRKKLDLFCADEKCAENAQF